MTRQIPSGFRGLRWEPTDEQEVVLLFGRLLDHIDTPLAIEEVGTTFPDCKAIDTATGRPIYIEFELYSSHFVRDHGTGRSRDIRCDWVVCWRDDLGSSRPKNLRVIALEDIVTRLQTDLILNTLPAAATQEERFGFRSAGLESDTRERIEDLRGFDWRSVGLIVSWPDVNGACFTVREPVGIEYFKVSSGGSITVPFSRWRDVSADSRRDIANKLNAAVGTTWFTGEGKKSRDIAQLLRGADGVRSFCDVWIEFARQRANTRMEPTRG